MRRILRFLVLVFVPLCFAGPTQADSEGPVEALKQGDAYIEAGAKADSKTLRKAATEQLPLVLKFAIFNTDSKSQTLVREGSRIRQRLRTLGGTAPDVLILGSNHGLAISTDEIDNDTLKELARVAAKDIHSAGYTETFVVLSQQVGEEIRRRRGTSNAVKVDTNPEAAVPPPPANEQETAAAPPDQPPPSSPAPPIPFIAIFAMIAVIAIALFSARLFADRRQAAGMRAGLEDLKSEVVSQMNYLEDNMSVVGAMAQPRVKEARLSAGNKLDEASRILVQSRSASELSRAGRLLRDAQTDLSRGKQAVERDREGGVAS